ncbi:L-fucose:H+ symporter permease [Echinicola jeungdonensis]|uniref:L-fucose:H+ symporter permease n=1 Tax=Echinicola jeungdonensis TaxID=709343 RepID=A0ABV5J3V1_9BACT|nr:L-fucose:H+ symporter permease [Echinicola jeungdonensis]MDN3668505.1 L-fucose:H+ symporter permease [Echinicola jeungdonensis]
MPVQTMKEKGKAALVSRETLIPFILITSLFLLWGLANNMTDTLLAAFKKILSMTDTQTSWIQMAFYGAYFCLALPAAIFIKKYSYKSGVLLGLGLFAVGGMLFYPASIVMSYGFFLFALYVLAGGLSILETSANPYILVMGPEESATRRLNLAQSFNPVGSIIGVLLSKVFILSKLNVAEAEERSQMSPEMLRSIQQEELSSVMGTYVGVALFLVLVWILIKMTPMPKASELGVPDKLANGFKRLMANKNYVFGVLAQFFYVGAQIGVWSFTIRYVMQELGHNESDASNYYLIAMFLFTGFRFVFTALMKIIRPSVLLSLASGLAICCTLVVIYANGMVGAIALVGISGCMSMMFPTIYGLAAQGLGDDTKLGGSGLIMAILGGAVFPVIQGLISDNLQSIQLSYYVPAGCFLVVMAYGIYHYNHKIEIMAAAKAKN